MMTVEFIAQSMAEAIRAISDLRAELEIAYEHLHAAEAEVARLKDALRQANGVRDVFASAVVAQAMQDPAEPKCDTCPRGVSNAIRNLKERRG